MQHLFSTKFTESNPPLQPHGKPKPVRVNLLAQLQARAIAPPTATGAECPLGSVSHFVFDAVLHFGLSVTLPAGRLLALPPGRSLEVASPWNMVGLDALKAPETVWTLKRRKRRAPARWQCQDKDFPRGPETKWRTKWETK